MIHLLRDFIGSELWSKMINVLSYSSLLILYWYQEYSGHPWKIIYKFYTIEVNQNGLANDIQKKIRLSTKYLDRYECYISRVQTS